MPMEDDNDWGRNCSTCGMKEHTDDLDRFGDCEDCAIDYSALPDATDEATAAAKKEDRFDWSAPRPSHADSIADIKKKIAEAEADIRRMTKGHE
tara:strand:- start:441 stop:722 length:282 start_codon:yes stop_codon:yes gene_type:complete